MKIDIVTLFPKLFDSVFSESIINNALHAGLSTICTHSLRDFSIDKRGSVDDSPYGGGSGMILRCEPVFDAVESIEGYENACKILLTPQGTVFNQQVAIKLSGEQHIILICGHYEGVDERIREHLIDMELSIGDYILTGGEIPAMVVTETILRLLPGVLGNVGSIENESFTYTKKGLLEYPQYTKPYEYRGHCVPEILISGNHQKIEAWRQDKAMEKTKKVRADLL